MTTHSPYMLGNNWHKNTYIVERNIKGKNETIVKQVFNSKDKDVPNLLFNKNNKIRYIESIKPRITLFI